MPISTIQSGSFPSNVAIDTDTLVVDGASNIVGVGTSAPSGAKLEIFTASTAVDGLKISRYTPGNYYSTLRQDSHGLAIHVGTGGTVSERVAITPNGITFNGDTAAADALDDYEEGVFNLSVGGTATYAAQQGRYVKIGGLVNIAFDFAINTIGTGSQTVISGLPYAAFTTTAGSIGYYSGLPITPVYPTFYATVSSTIQFAWNTSGSATIQNNGGVFLSNSSRVIGSCTYYTSS